MKNTDLPAKILRTTLLCLCSLLFMEGFMTASAADPMVSNVQASQRSGTQLVDITYDLADPDSSQLTVSIVVSDNAGATYAVPASSFTGDLGANVAPGTHKKITWDAGKDWAGKFSANMRFRVTADDQGVAPPPTGMALIPAGSFTMGDSLDGDSYAQPTHTVYVSAFYLDKTEVTKALWDEVYQWATNRPVAVRYDIDRAGSGKAPNHPVHTVNWYNMVKWCNARSEKEGRVPAYYTSAAQTTVYRSERVNVQNDWVKWNAGYRLPTEAEWEKAARGGSSGHRFPWGDTIAHSQANYYSTNSYSYDISSTRGYHPSYDNDPMPYTSPVGSFAANGYGLYDMAGNVWECCWDWSGSYSSSAQSDPRGPTSGSDRVSRGGGWGFTAVYCRAAHRPVIPIGGAYNIGFRSALPAGQ